MGKFLLYGRLRIRRSTEKKFSHEAGSIDSLLLLGPLLSVMLILFGLLQYGLSVNELNHTAALIGRQVAREPYSIEVVRLVTQKLQSQNVKVTDFHVMQIGLGNRTFIQLVLVGGKIRIGPIQVQPSGKSVILLDNWQSGF